MSLRSSVGIGCTMSRSIFLGSGRPPSILRSIPPTLRPITSSPNRSITSMPSHLRPQYIPETPLFSRRTGILASRSSILSSRTFTSSKSGWIRQTYFPKGSGGYSGGPRGTGGMWSNFRRRIDRIPVMTVIFGLIGANVGVFLLWQYGRSSWERFRDPALYQWLTKNFVLNENNIMAGRLWTLLTCCFSHESGSHILVNCMGLYFVAPAAASLVGSAAFLGLYLGGGIISSLTSLFWHRAMGDRWRGSEGASGAIYASLAFYGALFPSTTFLLFFVVPMPAWALVGGIFAYDVYSAVLRPNSGTDSAGHVGGILAGLGAALMVRRRGIGGFRRW